MTLDEVKKAVEGLVNEKSLGVFYEEVAPGEVWWVTEVVNNCVVNFWKVTIDYDDIMGEYPHLYLHSAVRDE